MLRTALKPRWLGLLVVVVLIGAAFVQLGRWQYGVARAKAAQEAVAAAQAAAPVELSTALAPHTEFPKSAVARRVVATGRYAAAGQLLVPGRLLRGQRGYWVVTPFVVDSTHATLAVLRGFVTGPELADTPPSATITVTGSLAPGESPTDLPSLPPGQIGAIDLSVLVNTWPGELYNAFLFLQQETPSAGGPARPEQLNTLTPVPTPRVDTGLKVRNAAYALQWWVFAAFAAYMWWRMVKDEARRERRRAEEDPESEPVAATGENGPRD